MELFEDHMKLGVFILAVLNFHALIIRGIAGH
jgi:hypothetical protein